jgi:hypothetical protein
MVFISEELLVRSQNDESFFWQNLQVPHLDEGPNTRQTRFLERKGKVGTHAIWNETTTRSPTLRFLTSGPTRSMTPYEAKRKTRESSQSHVLAVAASEERGETRLTMNSCPRMSPFCIVTISEW